MSEKIANTFEKARRYNTWEGQPVQIGYKRDQYLDKITKLLDTRLVKVLVGQRRAGKSYILRQIMNHLTSNKNVDPKNLFFVNKEFIAFEDIQTASDLEELFAYYRAQLKVKGKIYLFLDEVQNIENWETFVNSYSQDFTQEYELFVSGSNSNLLSGELATLLSGRYVEFEILPFGYSEYVQANELSEGKESFLEYLQTGGLPELIHLNSEELKRNYLGSLKNTIILRDILERHKIKDLPLLEEIFRFLAVNIGNRTSISNIIDYFKSRQKKTNYETVSSYVRFLTDTFIFHRSERFNLRGKQVLGGSSKYYLNDLAFKNFLFGFLPTDMGYNLENFVYLQLRRMGYNVQVGVLNNLEIDFIAQKSDKTVYVQVCYLLNSENVVNREFGNLLQIKDNYEKYVVSLDDMKFSDFEGIVHLHPWEFVNI
ncbi:ATP-binding protein [Puteibacter caeruleilacunae]|nr:ATP-binding protein [Puteibacter caeruleilacunae]